MLFHLLIILHLSPLNIIFYCSFSLVNLCNFSLPDFAFATLNNLMLPENFITSLLNSFPESLWICAIYDHVRKCNVQWICKCIALTSPVFPFFPTPLQPPCHPRTTEDCREIRIIIHQFRNGRTVLKAEEIFAISFPAFLAGIVAP